MRLTTKLARHHPAPEHGKIQLFDTQLTGLMVEIRPSGGRTYYVRYQDAENKTRQQRLAKAQDLSITEARKKARAVLADVRMGNDPNQISAAKQQAPTLRAFVEEHYLPFVRGYKKAWVTDESLLRNHLLPRFGEQRMDAITAYQIQQFIRELAATYRPTTVNLVLVILRYIYNTALRWQTPGIDHNPSRGIAKLTEYGRPERFLSAEETTKLIAHLDNNQNPHLRGIVTMLALTGARRGEVLQARWADIDLERCLWRIPQPKAREKRYVPLSAPLIELLQSLDTWQHSAYLFPNPRTGNPFGSIYTAWNRARHEAGLPDVRLHDLRHSFASFLVNSGHSLYEVQKLLGHTQIKTTQRYAHLSEERLLEASNDVGRLIANAAHGPEEKTQ